MHEVKKRVNKRARASAGWLSTSCVWSTVLRVLSAEAKDRNEAAKHNLGTRLVSCFTCKSRETQPTPARIAFSIRSALHGVGCMGLACETTLLIPSLYTSVNRTASFHVVRATGCLFGEVVNRSTSFQDAQPAFKLFGLFSKRDHFVLKADQPVWMTGL